MGPANMIQETLHAPEGANTLGAEGYLDLLNTITLTSYFQDLKLCEKRLGSCFYYIHSTRLKFIYVII